jgi:uncharacterized protein (TIGR00251 family)
MQLTDTDDGLLVTVRVRPRAARPGAAMEENALVISVSAPPADGKANQEAGRTLASVLGVPPSAVSLRAGARSKQKVFRVRGLTGERARRRLARTLGQGPQDR